MPYLEQLPPEVLERILLSPELRADDVMNCCRASQVLGSLCENVNFWMQKLRLHYPMVLEWLEKSRTQYTAQTIYGELCDLHPTMCLNIMALSNVFVWSLYQDYEWPDIPHRALDLYYHMFDQDIAPGVGPHYVADETYNIIHLGDRHRNLTLKYYARKVHVYVWSKLYFPLLWDDMQTGVDAASNPHTQFAVHSAAYRLAASIPMCERVNIEEMDKNMNIIIASVNERILQHRPDILKNSLRSNIIDNQSTCKFLLKQIHDCVRHEFQFKSVGDSVYKGYKYCIDKVLKSRVGDDKLIVSVEAIIAQRYKMNIEIHENTYGCWKIYYKTSKGIGDYYECPDCNLSAKTSTDNIKTNRINNTPPTILTVATYSKSILNSLVTNFERNLKQEWELAGGPIVYNLLSEETYNQAMRHIFNAWRHVEHWKIAQLRHYTLLLCKVSDDGALPGKLQHLNILLRVRSNQSLQILADYRRVIALHPPAGIRELQRMVASVNIRARARFQELNSMLVTSQNNRRITGCYQSIYHPNQLRPWPHGWPGSDMVQKRRIDRKSWHVQFAVGQIVQICRAKETQTDASVASESRTNNGSSLCKTAKTTISTATSSLKNSGYQQNVYSINDFTGISNSIGGGSSSSKNNSRDSSEATRIDLEVSAASKVKHRSSSGYGVVYDWDSMCTETDKTLFIMGETNLSCGSGQPFYNVLLDDGSSSYVAQENLKHVKNPRPINNPLLGRYFRAYIHPYYIPNMQKAYEYPEDATIREQDAFILNLL